MERVKKHLQSSARRCHGEVDGVVPGVNISDCTSPELRGSSAKNMNTLTRFE